MKRACALLLCAAAALARAGAAQITLPIYLEDNHAGSFYWLAEHLDLEEPCTLLHFDAHSDASGIFDSDILRTRLRRVASKTERVALLERWRCDGTIQCFNWIEALMPSPIARVIWIPREKVEPEEGNALAAKAGALLDGHLEASPRAAGPFRERYRVVGLDQLRDELQDGTPVIATVDLDYFAGMTPPEREAAFERVWSFIVAQRNLRAITIAISRPYLAGDEEADALVQLALRASLSLPTAKIHFEPFRTVGNDQSLRARDYRAEGAEVPAYEVAKSSAETRALLLGNAERLAVKSDATRWQKLLERWRTEAPGARLSIAEHEPSTDGIWRLPAETRAEIGVELEPWYAPLDRVQWFVQQPAFLRCNLAATRADEVGYAQGAPPRPCWREVQLHTEAKVLSVDELRPFLDAQTGCGAVRIKARIAFGTAIRETPAMEIRLSRGTGFRAALLEQFGLPYLFGAGALRDATSTGPETGWGADCANFLIYALRRQGNRIPWSNPRQLRAHLELVRRNVTLADGASISEPELERGLFVHFGTHVAAVMEDRAPIGVLNADDILAHQLEGAPELVSLGELLQRRGESRFDLLRLPTPAAGVDSVLGGDVMLGRSVGEQIKAGADPFAGIRPVLDRAAHRIINLECVISTLGQAMPGKRYTFRAPAEASHAIAAAGFDTIGQANNHAADFGAEALLDGMAQLRHGDTAVIGAGPTADEAYAARTFATANGKRVAVLAVSDVPDIEQLAQGAIVASASDRSALAAAIEKAKGEAEFVIVLVHWGEENLEAVTERQRELARWLVEQGVDLVAGSHPHCVQSLDFYRGRPIAYSLGNLVFDGAPTLASWNRGALLEVTLGSRRGSASVRMVPVRLDGRGFPHAEELPPPTDARSDVNVPITTQSDGALRNRAAAAASLANVAPNYDRDASCSSTSYPAAARR